MYTSAFMLMLEVNVLLATQGAADYAMPGTERHYNVYPAGTSTTGASNHTSPSYTPFTRYNLLLNRFDSRLSNRLDNQLDNRLFHVYKHPTGCQTGCTTRMTTSCIV